MSIKLNKDAEQRAAASIRRYCAEELEQDIGDLQAGLLLQFFLQEIGPSVYNKALADASAYIQEKAADMEINCSAAEFGYWTADRGNRRKR